MTERITGEQFVRELKRAPAWLIENTGNGLYLTVMENEKTSQFLGPYPLDMSDLEYRVFLNNVLHVSGIPAVGRLGGFVNSAPAPAQGGVGDAQRLHPEGSDRDW